MNQDCVDSQKKRFGSFIVSGAINISTMSEHSFNPIERLLKFMTPTISVEKRQGIYADYGVQSRPGGIKIDLEYIIGVAKLENFVHDAVFGMSRSDSGSESDGSGIDIAWELGGRQLAFTTEKIDGSVEIRDVLDQRGVTGSFQYEEL